MAQQQPHDDEYTHVVPASLYVGIWATLMVLTLTTVLASFAELGPIQYRGRVADRHHQGHAGRPVLHAPALQSKADHSRRDCRDVLVVHHVFPHHDGLPVACLVDLRRALTKIVGGQISGIRCPGSGIRCQ